MMKTKREGQREEEVDKSSTKICLLSITMAVLHQEDITEAEMTLRWTGLHPWEMAREEEEEEWDPHLQITMIITEGHHQDTTVILTLRIDITIRTTIVECLQWEVHQWDHPQEMAHTEVQDTVQVAQETWEEDQEARCQEVGQEMKCIEVHPLRWWEVQWEVEVKWWEVVQEEQVLIWWEEHQEERLEAEEICLEGEDHQEVISMLKEWGELQEAEEDLHRSIWELEEDLVSLVLHFLESLNLTFHLEETEEEVGEEEVLMRNPSEVEVEVDLPEKISEVVEEVVL